MGRKPGKSIRNERDAQTVIQEYLEGKGFAKADPV